MEDQKKQINQAQIVLVDKMIGLIAGGKTTGMTIQEEIVMSKALEFYKGYLTGSETKVPIKIIKNEPSKLNKKRKGTGSVRSRLVGIQQS